MRHLPRAAFLGAFLLLLLVDGRARGQDSAVIEYYNPHYGRYVSSVSAGMLSVVKSESPHNFTERSCQTAETDCGYWEGTSTARVSDLDLGNIEIQQGCCDASGMTSKEGFGLQLNCADGAKCVSEDGHFTGYVPPGGGRGSSDQIVVSCNSRSECSDFLDVLRGRQKPPIPPVRVETPPRPSQLPVAGSVYSASDFNGALSSIPWRNGSTRDLEDLAKQTAPAPRPPNAAPQLRYAAFAQSAGFDANGEVGTAIGGDLNGTIGAANVQCVTRAKTSCGDEGYCALRPGLYGAWATDHTYLGSKAFACNLKTEELAREQALAWCGADCRVEWSGDAR